MDTTIKIEPTSTAAAAPDATALYAHLAPPYRVDAACPDEARIECIKKGVVVEHAAYAAAMDYAHWLLSQPSGTPGRGMLLMGEPGAGKSTFGEELARDAAGQIVVISAEGARSMRELYGRVLQSLEGPVAKSTHTPDRELAVIRIFRALQVKALVVDEVQDLAKGTDRELQRVLAGIKYMTNTTRIPLICLGAPEATQTFRNDKHLAQRLRSFQLPVWTLDQSFADLVAVIQETLPLRKASALHNEAALKYLIEISQGSLRSIVARITCAAVRAIFSGEECLTLQALKDAEFAPPRQAIRGETHG